jgi:Transmembrane domain of unknown function (DUF3566)
MRRRFRRGVRLRRLVRRFELWSVLRVALFFHLFCFLLTLGALVVVWQIASRAGLVKNIETFLGDIGFDGKGSKGAAEGALHKDIELDGQVLLRAAAAIGAVVTLMNTLATVVMAFFYNMISGMFGGVVMSVLEEIPRPPRLQKQSGQPGHPEGKRPASGSSKPTKEAANEASRGASGPDSIAENSHVEPVMASAEQQEAIGVPEKS